MVSGGCDKSFYQGKFRVFWENKFNFEVRKNFLGEDDDF